MISVVVCSLNEGDKLKRCLASVKDFSKDIVVVNMESRDDTAEVAKKFGAKVVDHQRLDYVEPVRQFGVDQSKGDWIMIMDPDEVLPMELKKTLTQISKENSADAVNIPRLNFIFGKKIKHTNFWPDRQIRFFKRGKVQFFDMIHSYPKVSGKLVELSADEDLAIHHFPYKTVLEYWQRMQRYSDVEARNLKAQGARFSLIDLIYKPFYDFFRRYIRHLGFLDGWRGFILSISQFYYYILVEIKLLKIEQ